MDIAIELAGMNSVFEPGYQDISDAIKSADENLYLQKSKLKSERESKT